MKRILLVSLFSVMCALQTGCVGAEINATILALTGTIDLIKQLLGLIPIA